MTDEIWSVGQFNPGTVAVHKVHSDADVRTYRYPKISTNTILVLYRTGYNQYGHGPKAS